MTLVNGEIMTFHISCFCCCFEVESKVHLSTSSSDQTVSKILTSFHSTSKALNHTICFWIKIQKHESNLLVSHILSALFRNNFFFSKEGNYFSCTFGKSMAIKSIVWKPLELWWGGTLLCFGIDTQLRIFKGFSIYTTSSVYFLWRINLHVFLRLMIYYKNVLTKYKFTVSFSNKYLQCYKHWSGVCSFSWNVAKF